MNNKTPENGHLKYEFQEQSERLHRSILNSVSHDLKTPLACVIGSLEIYERTKEKLTPEKKDSLIDTALKEAYRLDSFITNILDMARLEGGAMKVKNEFCKMDLLIEDCLIMLGHSLAGCPVSIKAIPEPFSVTTDPLLLMRAICIVLDNAAKYCIAGSPIEIEYEMAGDEVIIRIRDNGPGIPESKLEAIFSKYTRFASEDYKRAGTGLGLPICRAIMILLGGTVTAVNRVGKKGALFALIFPISL